MKEGRALEAQAAPQALLASRAVEMPLPMPEPYTKLFQACRSRVPPMMPAVPMMPEAKVKDTETHQANALASAYALW